nr:uncharacterized protein LOC103347812 [Oryctolagus cuniculus]
MWDTGAAGGGFDKAEVLEQILTSPEFTRIPFPPDTAAVTVKNKRTSLAVLCRIQQLSKERKEIQHALSRERTGATLFSWFEKFLGKWNQRLCIFSVNLLKPLFVADASGITAFQPVCVFTEHPLPLPVGEATIQHVADEKTEAQK